MTAKFSYFHLFRKSSGKKSIIQLRPKKGRRKQLEFYNYVYAVGLQHIETLFRVINKTSFPCLISIDILKFIQPTFVRCYCHDRDTQ